MLLNKLPLLPNLSDQNKFTCHNFCREMQEDREVKELFMKCLIFSDKSTLSCSSDLQTSFYKTMSSLYFFNLISISFYYNFQIILWWLSKWLVLKIENKLVDFYKNKTRKVSFICSVVSIVISEYYVLYLLGYEVCFMRTILNDCLQRFFKILYLSFKFPIIICQNIIPYIKYSVIFCIFYKYL